MLDTYVIVPYDQSEEFEDTENSYFIYDPFYTGQDVPIVVPEQEYCKKKGLPYKFSNTVTNEELINILSKFPKDAVIGIEYCNPKKLQYFPDRNFIAID